MCVFTSVPNLTKAIRLLFIEDIPVFTCRNNLLFCSIIALVFLELLDTIYCADLAVAIETASDTLLPTVSTVLAISISLSSSSSTSKSISKSVSKSSSKSKSISPIKPLANFSSYSLDLSLLYHLPDFISDMKLPIKSLPT